GTNKDRGKSPRAGGGAPGAEPPDRLDRGRGVRRPWSVHGDQRGDHSGHDLVNVVDGGLDFDILHIVDVLELFEQPRALERSQLFVRHWRGRLWRLALTHA